MCEKAIEKEVYYAPGHFKAHRMCEKAVSFNPYSIALIPDRFKTKKTG